MTPDKSLEEFLAECEQECHELVELSKYGCKVLTLVALVRELKAQRDSLNFEIMNPPHIVEFQDAQIIKIINGSGE